MSNRSTNLLADWFGGGDVKSVGWGVSAKANGVGISGVKLRRLF